MDVFTSVESNRSASEQAAFSMRDAYDDYIAASTGVKHRSNVRTVHDPSWEKHWLRAGLSAIRGDKRIEECQPGQIRGEEKNPQPMNDVNLIGNLSNYHFAASVQNI